MHYRTALAAATPEHRTARWIHRDLSGHLSFLVSRGATIATSMAPAHDDAGHRVIGLYTPTPQGHLVTVYAATDSEDHDTVLATAAELIDEGAKASVLIARPLDDYLPAADVDFSAITPEMILGGAK